MYFRVTKSGVPTPEAAGRIARRRCAEKPIDWTVSVWDLDSLKFALLYDLKFLKIRH